MSNKKSIVKIVGISLALSLLSTSCFSQKKTEEKSSKETVVKYELASRYFIKNTVPEGSFIYKLTNQNDFDELFGAAAVMGKDGKPTPIDFEKSIVVAVISESSNKSTQITPLSLSLTKDKKLNLNYKVDVSGEASSMTTRVPLILIVDKKYNKELTASLSGEKVDYKTANRYFINNSVEEGLIYLTDITTQEKFDTYFGPAAVMGEGGIPTEINFEKEFVAGIIYNSTTSIPELKIESVTKSNGEIRVLYSANKVEKGERWREPAILILSKENKEKIKFIELIR